MILLILLLVILVYISNYKEHLTDLEFYRNTKLYDKPKVKLQYYEGTSQYALLDKFNIQPVLDDNNYKNPNPNNDKFVDMHSEKNWHKRDIQSETKQILQEVKEEGIPLEFTHNNNKYNYIGKAYNGYYNQNYLLYERLIRNTPVVFNNDYGDYALNEIEISTNKDNLDNLNYQIYEYILVENKNNKMNVIYNFTPRTKINPYDIVHLSLGVLKIGPILVKN